METLAHYPLCNICQKPANQHCGGCKLVHYCCRAHQKLDWREGHKFKCCAFKIQYSDTLGRHMMATRDIQKGEMILKEKPAVIGPRMTCLPTCLGCHKKLDPTKQDNGNIDYYKCTSCGWPMCGPKCETAEIHKPECELMLKRKYKSTIRYEGHEKSEPAYCVITPLRVLLMKKSNPIQYDNIMNLETHLNEKIGTSVYRALRANLATFVIQVLGLTEFGDDKVLATASLLDTNAFDVRFAEAKKSFRAIYLTGSMMTHDCSANTKHVYTEHNHMAIIATVDIAKGDLLTYNYTQKLQGTMGRRMNLRSVKCMECECVRCKDPTEFKTYFGSIYCSACVGAGVGSYMGTVPKIISINPLDDSSDWKCEKCEHTVPAKQMHWGNNAIKKELKGYGLQNPSNYEKFIEKYKHTLHASNYHIVQAKCALAQIYGNSKEYKLEDLSDNLLARKIALCNELIEVADVLDPGWSRFRGGLLLDLQAAMTLQTKRDFESDKITKHAAQELLGESMNLLREATDILRVEPDLQPILEQRIEYLSSLLECEAEDASEKTNKEDIENTNGNGENIRTT